MKKLILVLLSFCVSISAQIKDIIPVINLTSGATDSILVSDLFYSPGYNLTFLPNSMIKTLYKPSERKLYLKPDKEASGLNIIRFQSGSTVQYMLTNSKKKHLYKFEYEPEKGAENINLFGSFNSWNRSDLPMTDTDKDGVYEITVPLEPGLYEYKFFVDGTELLDPNNPESKPNGLGGFNSIITIKEEAKDKAYLHLLDISKNENGASIKLFYEKENQTNKLKIDNILALIDNRLVIKNNIKIDGNFIEIFFPEDRLARFKQIRAAVNSEGVSSNIQTVFTKNLLKKDEKINQDKIIYALMVDRFNDGDKSNSIPVEHPELKAPANYQGGDLQGIIDKLNEGYFSELGINTLWISPIIDNTDSAYMEYPEPHRYYTGYHGYWPVSSTRVEERFGDLELFKKLVQTAHEKNIKVLLDFVANHVHIEHPFWEAHRDWFGMLELPDGKLNLRLWDEQRLTTWFEPYMPSFDFSSEAALDTMTNNAVWWIKETGIDGFRHDAVKHVPNEFWRMLTEKIKGEFPDRNIYQIGETFGSYQLVSSYVNNGQLDAQFNFNLYDTAIPTFIDENGSFENLSSEVQKTLSVYGVNHVMGNVMDSHDKTRFMAYADGDVKLSEGGNGEIGWKNPPEVDDKNSYKKLRLYLAYMLTMPGVPIIYYGDEIGMTGAADPDNRRMMRFGEQVADVEKENLEIVKKIIALRNNNSALRYGDFQTLIAKKDIYAYLRSDGEQKIIVVLNKGKNAENISIKIPAIYRAKEAVDLLSGESYQIKEDELKVEVESEEFAVVKISTD